MPRFPFLYLIDMWFFLTAYTFFELKKFDCVSNILLVFVNANVFSFLRIVHFTALIAIL